MGNSQQRTLFFEKHIRKQPTAQAYLNALRDSPYRTHNRMAIALSEIHNQMLEATKQIGDVLGTEHTEEV